MAAEDIATDSLVKYWKLLSSEGITTSDALLLTIVKNKCLDYLKHEAIHQTTIESLADINNRELSIRISTLEACNPEEIFSAEIRSIINRTLADLPEQTRRIFEMSRFDNKTVKEIAENAGLTSKAVEYHITKALKVLRIALKDYLPITYFFLYY